MKFVIKPFVSAGELKFGTDRKLVNAALGSEFKEVFENTPGGDGFVTDYRHDEGIMSGYFTKDFKLAYIILTDPCEVVFEGENLLGMNYTECLRYMKKFDADIEEEEYVGFTSYKYGISIYAENATDDPECDIKSVTIAEGGLF
jgi:hypothetical protein